MRGSLEAGVPAVRPAGHGELARGQERFERGPAPPGIPAATGLCHGGEFACRFSRGGRILHSMADLTKRSSQKTEPGAGPAADVVVAGAGWPAWLARSVLVVDAGQPRNARPRTPTAT